jgi:hypothetical protein
MENYKTGLFLSLLEKQFLFGLNFVRKGACQRLFYSEVCRL